MEPVTQNLATAHLWERYDACAAVNRTINAEHRGEGFIAIADAKREALLKKGLPRLDVAVADLSIDGGERFECVVLVRDRIARWVLRAEKDGPESLPQLGVRIKDER